MPRLGDAKLKGGLTTSQPTPKKGRKKQASLFDAVAGRITSEGFLPVNPNTSKYRDTISRSTEPVSPERVLFRFKGRAFQGDFDPYWAHEQLEEAQKLPDSDLLKAIHAYASDFYGKSFGEEAQVDYYSLDETALLCLGVLMEEMADEVLGDTGDLAFTEGEAVQTTVEEGSMQHSENATSAPMESMREGDVLPPKPGSSKRRKMKHEA